MCRPGLIPLATLAILVSTDTSYSYSRWSGWNPYLLAMEHPQGLLAYLLLLQGIVVFYPPPTVALKLDYLDKHCGRSVKVEDAVHLKLTSMLSYAPNLDCEAALYNEARYKMMVRVIRVDINNSTHCHTDRMEIFKHRYTDRTPLVVICGTHAPDKTFITSREGMVARFISGDEAQFEGFDIVVTPFYTGLCDDESFECDNKRCIADNLACDGYNNCGDNSDETVNCGLSTGFIVAVALVSVSVVCLLVVTVYAFAFKKCGLHGYQRIL